MPQLYATDTLGASIRAFFAQMACDECGSAPDIETQSSHLVPANSGFWLLSAFCFSACRKIIFARIFLRSKPSFSTRDHFLIVFV